MLTTILLALTAYLAFGVVVAIITEVALNGDDAFAVGLLVILWPVWLLMMGFTTLGKLAIFIANEIRYEAHAFRSEREIQERTKRNLAKSK